MRKSEDDLKDSIKWANIHIIGIPDGERRKWQKAYTKK